MTKFSELGSAGTLSNADIIAILQGATVKGLTYASLRSAISASDRWQVIPAASYNSAPASTSQITMSDSSGIGAYYPVRVDQSGTYIYSYATDVQPTYVQIIGPPMATNDDIDSLEVGSPEMIVRERLHVPGTFNGSTTTTLYATTGKRNFTWVQADAYLVQCAAFAATTGSTAPKINILRNGTRVLTSDSGNGVQPNSGWSGLGEVDPDEYKFQFTDALEIEVTSTGVGTWGDLTVSLLFVRG